MEREKSEVQSSEVPLEGKVENSADALNREERLVIQLAFGLGDGQGKDNEEIAKEMGISEQEVKELYQSGMSKVRR